MKLENIWFGLKILAVGMLASAVILAPMVMAQPVTGGNTGSNPITGSTGTFSGSITASSVTAGSVIANTNFQSFGSATFNSILVAASGSSLPLVGQMSNSAGNFGVKLYPITAFTRGTDRFPVGIYNDNGTTLVARIDSAGGYQTTMGTSTGYSIASGVANTNSTAVGNVGASAPDDLITYTLPASALIDTNRVIRITAWGTCANTANAKSFTINFGSQVIGTHSCTASVANERWVIHSRVIRTGSSAQDWVTEFSGNTGAAGAFVFDPEIGTATQTETGTIVIKMQSTTSTTDNDIVQEGMIVEYL